MLPAVLHEFELMACKRVERSTTNLYSAVDAAALLLVMQSKLHEAWGSTLYHG